MATFVAILCVITVACCVPLAVLKPKWVFYIFLIVATFNSILAGYINRAGNLGLPLTWAPADFLAWLTLFAALFVHREKYFRSGIIKKCIIILALISALSLIQGMLTLPRDALTHSRVVHFAAAAIFSLRYFTDYSRVKGFFKFCIVLLMVMFVFHIFIRFGIYSAPIAEDDRIVEIGGLVGERGTRALIPMLYLVLISMAIGRLVSKVGFFIVSVLMLMVGLAGVVLSETRSTYGALAVLFLASLVFMRGRIRNSILYMFVALFSLYAASLIGFDFLARFRADNGQGDYSVPTYYQWRHGWRGMEYETIASSFKQEPYFLLTGRGVGAMHPAPKGVTPLVAFYHSEYLGWLDRCGLIGLTAVLILFFACLWRSFILARSNIPYLDYFGITSFLLLIALAADGFFHPIFSHYRAASLLICFAAITANWPDIYQSITGETAAIEQEEEPELALGY
jgi:O-antigen ligase